MTLGARLREIRLSRGLTQKQISAYLNISRSTYAHYEIGSREPDIESLKRIAEILSVSLDYLAGRSRHTATADQIFDYLTKQKSEISDLLVSDLEQTDSEKS